jgi:hypothetical protein
MVRHPFWFVRFWIDPNTKSTWNQFKCENLKNSNYDNSYGGSKFSHAYVIMHEYFGKKTKNEKNEYKSFYRQLDMFSCTCDLNPKPKPINFKSNKYK